MGSDPDILYKRRVRPRDLDLENLKNEYLSRIVYENVLVGTLEAIQLKLDVVG